MINNNGVYTNAKQTARGERRREERNNNEESEEPLFNNAQGITERREEQSFQSRRETVRELHLTEIIDRAFLSYFTLLIILCVPPLVQQYDEAWSFS